MYFSWRAVIHGVAKSQTPLSDWTELNWGNAENLSVLELQTPCFCAFSESDPTSLIPKPSTEPSNLENPSNFSVIEPISTSYLVWWLSSCNPLPYKVLNLLHLTFHWPGGTISILLVPHCCLWTSVLPRWGVPLHSKSWSILDVNIHWWSHPYLAFAFLGCVFLFTFPFIPLQWPTPMGTLETWSPLTTLLLFKPSYLLAHPLACLSAFHSIIPIFIIFRKLDLLSYKILSFICFT